MRPTFIKDLTDRELKKQEEFIKDYDKKAEERGSTAENPLTADALRRAAKHLRDDEDPAASPKPK